MRRLGYYISPDGKLTPFGTMKMEDGILIPSDRHVDILLKRFRNETEIKLCKEMLDDTSNIYEWGMLLANHGVAILINHSIEVENEHLIIFSPQFLVHSQKEVFMKLREEISEYENIKASVAGVTKITPDNDPYMNFEEFYEQRIYGINKGKAI